MDELVVGIDLGTTNSLIAVYQNQSMKIIEIDGDLLLPSYVGLTPSNDLLIGHPARNQFILHPDRTIKSIKRRMGGTERIQFGERSLLPEEISALILSHLKSRAESALGVSIRKAVITVPAYFNDTQRQATRIAGEIAGLEVMRIVNEPTAGALAFRNSVLANESGGQEISVVYDLGGGTFDVSVVREEGDVTEVMASRGDTRLGGDDFDQLILDHMLSSIQSTDRVDLRDRPQAMNRLMHAAEKAKIDLSLNPYTHIIEEGLAEVDGKTVHLDLELSRHQYEDMIRSLVDRTVSCIQQALHDVELSPSEIDNVLLVGGSTRTPLVRKALEDYFHMEPRSELHPDHCVVMGAAILAARLQGMEVENILVDITPYSFGIRAVILNKYGMPNFNHCAHIIHRNTPLPITKSEEFFTSYDNQETVQIEVFQGESDDTNENTKIGDFHVNGLSKAPEGNVVIGRMSLDLNGILTVTAVEKRTGLQKSIKIEGAHHAKNPEEIAASRNQLADWLQNELDEESVIETTNLHSEESDGDSGLPAHHRELIDRAKGAFERMHPDDRKEAEALCARIEEFAAEGKDYEKPLNDLQEILYFVGA